MIEDLTWLGIHWTSPMIVQSERIALYRAAFERLLASGHAYACTCSRKELAQMTQAPHEDTDDEPIYTGRCRPQREVTPQVVQPNPNYRFRVPDGESIPSSISTSALKTSLRAKTSATSLSGARMAYPVISLPARWTMPRCRSPRLFVEPTCSNRRHGRSFFSVRSSCNSLHTSTRSFCATSTAFAWQKRHDALALRTLRQQGFPRICWIFFTIRNDRDKQNPLWLFTIRNENSYTFWWGWRKDAPALFLHPTF